MIVLRELSDRAPERPFPDENQAVQARFLGRSYEAFGVRVQIRGMRGEAYRLHARGGQCLTKCLTEERVPIVQQEALPAQSAIDRIGDLATALRDPCAVRPGHDASNVDAPRGQFHDEEDSVTSQPRPGPHVNREEIRSGEYLPVGPQKFLPGRPPLPLRSRFNAVPLEDVGDRAARETWWCRLASAP